MTHFSENVDLSSRQSQRAEWSLSGTRPFNASESVREVDDHDASTPSNTLATLLLTFEKALAWNFGSGPQLPRRLDLDELKNGRASYAMKHRLGSPSLDAANEPRGERKRTEYNPQYIEDEDVSFRKRLKQVNVDPALHAEVDCVVRWKGEQKRRGRRLTNRTMKLTGLPLKFPFIERPKFIHAAQLYRDLPSEGPVEIAFIGRSNVGKSSLLNALAEIKRLAKVSDKPGMTQALNFFKLNSQEHIFRFVDMPGYGFAFAKDQAVARWRNLSSTYFQNRKTLKLVLVLVDLRTGMKENDMQICGFLEAQKVPYSVVFTKADLGGHPDRCAQVTSVALEQLERGRAFQRPASIVSSVTGAGVGRLQRRILEIALGHDPLANKEGHWSHDFDDFKRMGKAAPLVKGGIRKAGRGKFAGGRGGGSRGRGGLPGRGRGRDFKQVKREKKIKIRL